MVEKHEASATIEHHTDEGLLIAEQNVEIDGDIVNFRVSLDATVLSDQIRSALELYDPSTSVLSIDLNIPAVFIITKP